MTSKILYEILFSSCACVADECKAHFIRRTPGNQTAFAYVLLPYQADTIRPLLIEEFFFLQEINEDGLHYFVLWQRDEWDHSNERRAVLRKEYQQNDIAFLTKTARDRRLEMIIANLSATGIFPKDKAVAYAKSLTSGTEESYAAKSQALVKVLTPLIDKKLVVYFPLSEILKQIDHRHVIPEETIKSLAAQESNIAADTQAAQESGEQGQQNHQVTGPTP